MMWTRVRLRVPAAFLQILGVLLLLIVFVAVNTMVERLTHLPVSNYHKMSPVIELFRCLGWPLALAIGVGAGIIGRFGHLLAPWENLDFGIKLRFFVVILATTTAWPLVTAGYNYYFDQGYTVEKVMLVALLPLVWWRPVFVYPFIAVAYLLLWQLGEPSLGGSILAHKLQVLRSLNVFAAAFLVYAVTGNRSVNNLLVLICCFVAAAYWIPALTKLNLAWLSEDRLHLIPLSAYAHGWLAFLPPDRIVDISRQIAPFDAAMRIFVIVAEGLCLIFLWRRWLCFSLLSVLIVFHLGVFAIYGFLFWTWISLDIALLVLLINTTGKTGAKIFNWPNLVVSTVLIAFSSAWAMPPKLGWYDTPLTYTYRVEAVDERGQAVHIHPGFFAPYDDFFAMSSFAYLVPDRAVLVSAYGVTNDRDLLRKIINSGDATAIFEIEKHSDNFRYDEARATRLQEFLERFLANRATRGGPAGWVRALRAPQQFWSFRGEFPDASEIRQLALVEVTSYYDGKQLKDIRKRELARIPLRRNSVE